MYYSMIKSIVIYYNILLGIINKIMIKIFEVLLKVWIYRLIFGFYEKY